MMEMTTRVEFAIISIVLLISVLCTTVSAASDEYVSVASLPLTGTIIAGGFPSVGTAYLHVDNPIPGHAVLILTDAGSKIPIVAFFLRKGASYKITRVPAGSYNLYYESGLEWENKNHQFTDGEMAVFTDENRMNPGIVEYDTETAGYEITLSGELNGAGNIRSVERGAFPDISRMAAGVIKSTPQPTLPAPSIVKVTVTPTASPSDFSSSGWFKEESSSGFVPYGDSLYAQLKKDDEFNDPFMDNACSCDYPEERTVYMTACYSYCKKKADKERSDRQMKEILESIPKS